MSDPTSGGFVCQICGATWQGMHSCPVGGVGVGAICQRCGSMYCPTPGLCHPLGASCVRCGYPGGSASWELLSKLAEDRRHDRAAAIEECARLLDKEASRIGAIPGPGLAEAVVRQQAANLRGLIGR